MGSGVITWLSLLQLFQVFFCLLKQSRGHLIQGDDTVVLQSQHDSIQVLADVLHVLVQLRMRKLALILPIYLLTMFFLNFLSPKTFMTSRTEYELIKKTDRQPEREKWSWIISVLT